VFKKDWTTSSKYLNHSRFNNQHDWGDLYDHLMNTRNVHFDNEEDIHMSSKTYEANDYGNELDLLIINLHPSDILYEKWVQREQTSI
jgi:hypothetical protein